MAVWPESPEELTRALRAFNRVRPPAPPDSPQRAALEDALDALFRAPERLAAYGSLMPGGANHHEVADLKGEWVEGWVTGSLVHLGWGSAAGYPALRWDPAGAPVRASMLTSPGLRTRWPRLDRFEGPDYRRILVPFFTDAAVVAVGNLYELEPGVR
jgi:gamma-glutamylcyclotransferase (GGCT)/AIG2-like uncharacterized protein YtfP